MHKAISKYKSPELKSSPKLTRKTKDKNSRRPIPANPTVLGTPRMFQNFLKEPISLAL